MKPICPRCEHLIESEAINIQADLAKCENCGEIFKASELVVLADIREHLEPPKESRITFVREGESDAVIEIPRRAFGRGDIFRIGFVSFWLGFIAFWTLGASQGSIFFALFSLPFWAAGIYMLVSMINSLTERQRIRTSREEIAIQRIRPFFAKSHTIQYADIASVAVERRMPRNPGMSFRQWRQFGTGTSSDKDPIPLPTITHGTQKTFFAEEASEAEMTWLVNVLKAVIFQKTHKRV